MQADWQRMSKIAVSPANAGLSANRPGKEGQDCKQSRKGGLKIASSPANGGLKLQVIPLSKGDNCRQCCEWNINIISSPAKEGKDCKQSLEWR